MPKYVCKNPLKVHHKRFDVDAQVELDEKVAAPLLAGGDIVPFKPAKAAKASGLFGSEKHAPEIQIAEGVTVQLGDVVNQAFTASGLDTEQWNALGPADREQHIDAAIEAMKAAHADKKPAKPPKTDKK